MQAVCILQLLLPLGPGLLGKSCQVLLTQGKSFVQHHQWHLAGLSFTFPACSPLRCLTSLQLQLVWEEQMSLWYKLPFHYIETHLCLVLPLGSCQPQSMGAQL